MEGKKITEVDEYILGARFNFIRIGLIASDDSIVTLLQYVMEQLSSCSMDIRLDHRKNQQLADVLINNILVLRDPILDGKLDAEKEQAMNDVLQVYDYLKMRKIPKKK